MIKVISVDFWNTIVDTGNSELRRKLRLERFHDLCKTYNPEIEKHDIESAIEKSIKWFEMIWENEHRTVISSEIITNILTELKFSVSETDFELTRKIFECGVLEAEPNLAHDIESSLQILSQKFKFGIISDTHFSPGKVLRTLLEQKKILHYFTAFSFSDERGVSKPHPEMYKHIMNQLGCKSDEMIHIGDMIRTDITGANQLGIKSILFTGINKHDSGNENADFEANSWTDIVSILDALQ